MKFLTPEQTFQRYESVRARLPKANFINGFKDIPDLSEVASNFDAVVFDSYGVLNVGPVAIERAAERVHSLRVAGKAVRILTNAAGVPSYGKEARYVNLGFDFSEAEIVTSRDALAIAMAEFPHQTWAVMAHEAADITELPGNCLAFSIATAQEADGFVLLSNFDWTERKQAELREALRERPRTVLVGNPDLVAPTPEGHAVQPGYHAHDLADDLGLEPIFFGKPFQNVFDIVKQSLPAGTEPERVLMVGDSLHTDILGGAAAGFKTALAMAHGVHTGADIEAFIAQSGIVPDYVLPKI